MNADITLSGWAANNEESALVKELVASFEETHSAISVDYNPIQSKYKQKIKTQLGAGNAPDAFYVDSSYFPSFASANVLLSMDELEASEEYNTDDFFQPLLEAFRFDGTLYGVPKDFSTLGLFHNTAMLEEASVEPPETWSDLEDVLSALKDNVSNENFKAPMIEFANARSWWAFLFQNGGQVLSDDGSEVVFASDAGVEALEYLVGLREDGLLALPTDLGSAGTALRSRAKKSQPPCWARGAFRSWKDTRIIRISTTKSTLHIFRSRAMDRKRLSLTRSPTAPLRRPTVLRQRVS
ncbi:extracellular solute-binding protein [Halomicroarcula sp. GCM10025709]|uniref:extracellular solute-binding protein n=1 Tax=Halomicroarcula sp. GCM10025709 TaxID=3252669 RepID=UPI003610AC3B